MSEQERPWEHRVWDIGLQPERTTLAWQRTALSATACSLVAARLIAESRPILGIVMAVLAIGCGVGIALAARRRHQRALRAIHSNIPVPDARGPFWMTALIVIAGGGVTVAVVLSLVLN